MSAAKSILLRQRIASLRPTFTAPRPPSFCSCSLQTASASTSAAHAQFPHPDEVDAESPSSSSSPSEAQTGNGEIEAPMTMEEIHEDMYRDQETGSKCELDLPLNTPWGSRISGKQRKVMVAGKILKDRMEKRREEADKAAEARSVRDEVERGVEREVDVQGELEGAAPLDLPRMEDLFPPLPSDGNDPSTSSSSKPSLLSYLPSTSDPLPAPTSSSTSTSSNLLRTLLTCKPTRPPRPHHESYEWIYNGHYEKLNLAFLKEQLWEMYEALRLDEEGWAEGMDDDLPVSTSAPTSTPPTNPITTSSSSTSTSHPADTSAARKPYTLTNPTANLQSLKPLRKSYASKKEIIERIMLMWGWPTKRSVFLERKIREKKYRFIDKTMILNSAEYHFLRKDSTFIRDLSTRHLINLTLDRGSSPIATAKPTNTSSDASDASNATTAKAIADEKVPEGGIRLIMKGRQFDLELFEAELGAQLRRLRSVVIGDDKYGRLEHLYQTISVMSDAFVEGVEGDNLRISFYNIANKDKALNLLDVAHARLTHTTANHSLYTISAPSPTSSSTKSTTNSELALYPYIPPTASIPSALAPSSAILKSDIGADWFLAGQGWFRVREKGSWFMPRREEGRHGYEKLAEGPVDSLGGQEAGFSGIEDLLKGEASQGGKEDGLRTEIEYGQVLLTAKDEPTTNWTTPFFSDGDAVHLAKQLSETPATMVFLPGSYIRPHAHKVISNVPQSSLRLIYRQVDVGTVEQGGLQRTVRIEAALAPTPSSPDDAAPGSRQTLAGSSAVGKITAESSEERVRFCLRPHRETDVRITQSQSRPMPVPEEISQYIAEFARDSKSSMTPPDSLSVGDTTYQLDTATLNDTFADDARGVVFESSTDAQTSIRSTRLQEKVIGTTHDIVAKIQSSRVSR